MLRRYFEITFSLIVTWALGRRCLSFINKQVQTESTKEAEKVEFTQGDA